MKYIFTLVFLLFMPGILRAEPTSLTPKPVPAPTTFRTAMDIEHGESLSSKSAKAELKDLVAELKQDKDLRAYIICNEKSERSKAALRMANQIKNYLVKKEGIKSDRITVVIGGNSDIWKIRIYLVPPEKPAEDSSEQKLDAGKIQSYKELSEKAASIGQDTIIKRKVVSKTPLYVTVKKLIY